MRYLLLGIVLVFPVADLYTTVRVAQWTGIPVWLWLTCSTLAGFSLMRSERDAFRAATVSVMHGRQPMLRGLVDSGRKVLAALLFLLPGLISDIVALLLLALPLNVGPQPQHAGAGRKSYIDGDYRRLD
jgi:UPF0716 protein FxsA